MGSFLGTIFFVLSFASLFASNWCLLLLLFAIIVSHHAITTFLHIDVVFLFIVVVLLALLLFFRLLLLFHFAIAIATCFQYLFFHVFVMCPFTLLLLCPPFLLFKLVFPPPLPPLAFCRFKVWSFSFCDN